MCFSRILALFLTLFLTHCMGVAPYDSCYPPGSPNCQTGTNLSAPSTSPPPLPEPDPPIETEYSCRKQDRDHICKKNCKSIYRKQPHTDRCEREDISKIEDLLELHEHLEYGDTDSLENIQSDEDFKTYLKISTTAISRILEGYSKSQAIDFLYWILDHENKSKLLQNKDDGYGLLESLLKSFDKSHTNYEAFTKDLEREVTLIDLVLENLNEPALDWFESYLYEKNCPMGLNKECFKAFCQIGKEMQGNNQREWLYTGHFFAEEIIEKVIQVKINVHTTTTNKWYNRNSSQEYKLDAIHKIEDLSGDWLILCNQGCDTSNNNNNTCTGSTGEDLTE